MKFNEPLMVKIDLDYSVFEETAVDNSGIDIDIPNDPRFSSRIDMDENDPRYGTFCGGQMDWFLLQYPEEHQVDPIMKIQLMRIWVTQMYTQMAAGLSFTNEVDTTIKTNLTEEELDMLATINTKVIAGVYEEMWNLEKSLVKKKKIKKIDL